MKNWTLQWSMVYRKVLRSTALLYTHLGQDSFFHLWAVLCGFVTGFAVVSIRLVAAWLGMACGLFPYWLLPIAVIVGLWTAWGIKTLLHDTDSSSDMTQLIHAIRDRNPVWVKLETISHILAAPITIGVGGVAGMATPSVLTGASIGNRIGGFLQLPNDPQTRLMACGAAAGIAAVFNSPISGVLFAMEVLLPATGLGKLIPLLLSAAAATAISQMIFGAQSLFVMDIGNWQLSTFIYFCPFGVLCALIGIYMVNCNSFVDRQIRKYLQTPRMRVAIGSVVLAAILFVLPALRGDGTSDMAFLLSGEKDGVATLWWMAIILMFSKIIVSSLTLTCGGAGGFFTPTLATGAFAGVAFAKTANLFGCAVNPVDFAALGMCGVFASAFQAPLTGIFLVVELSGSYYMMLPLIAVGAISFFITILLERNSIYTDLPREPAVDRENPMIIALEKAEVTKLAQSYPVVKLEQAETATSDEVRIIVDPHGSFVGIALPDKWKKKYLLPLGIVSEKDSLLLADAMFHLYREAYIAVRQESGEVKTLLAKSDFEAWKKTIS